MKPLNHLSAFMTTIAVVSFLPVPCPLAAQDIAAKNGLSVLRDTMGHYRIAASDETKEDPFAVQVIPPSPQSAIYRKYLDHAIDESTGIPDISIPLFEIRLKELTIPVTLSYHASGVKAFQYDGDVGAGWSINVGGYKVMRTIYGLEDERYPH